MKNGGFHCNKPTEISRQSTRSHMAIYWAHVGSNMACGSPGRMDLRCFKLNNIDPLIIDPAPTRKWNGFQKIFTLEKKKKNRNYEGDDGQHNVCPSSSYNRSTEVDSICSYCSYDCFVECPFRCTILSSIPKMGGFHTTSALVSLRLSGCPIRGFIAGACGEFPPEKILIMPSRKIVLDHRVGKCKETWCQ